MPKYKTIDVRIFNVKVEDVNSFTSRFPNATLIEDVISDPQMKQLKTTAVQGAWGANIPLKYKLAVSTAALFDGLKDPVLKDKSGIISEKSTKEISRNILKLINNLNYYTENIEKTKSNYKWKKFAYELEKFIYNL